MENYNRDTDVEKSEITSIEERKKSPESYIEDIGPIIGIKSESWVDYESVDKISIHKELKAVFFKKIQFQGNFSCKKIF